MQMGSSSKKVVVQGGVDEYIAASPKEFQSKLREIRSVIREVAPDAIETLSYFDIPGYSYEGYDYNGMFAWFSYKKPFIRLHVRPPVAKDHAKELIGCKISTGVVSFPEEREVSPAMITKLVTASLKVMRDGAK
jgi:uncharacterized protein YdhG (YjbR/CyaY superfamily)